MGLETGTYIADLVPTNPLAADLRSVGDDHLRLLKTTVKNTLPNGDRAQYFKRAATKTANYVVLSTDMERSFSGDATAGAFSFTLPTLVAGNDGWCCEVVKSDSSANAVTIVGTINGETNIVLKKQYQTARFLWTGTAWLAFFPIIFRDGTYVAPVGTTATRPGSPQKGAFWYNDTTSSMEYSDATNWFALLTTLQGAQLAYGGIINGTIVESRGANAATFAVKTLAGADPSPADPVLLAFRSATQGSGAYVFRKIEAAMSLTISSGSLMGFSGTTGGRLWFTIHDNAGALQLGAINCRSAGGIFPLGQIPLATTVAEGGLGAADSAGVIYSTSVVTSKPYLVFGFVDYDPTVITAGAYSQPPTTIQLFSHGVPLPGAQVQLVPVLKTDTSTIAITIGTFTDITGITANIVMTSAANVVQMDWALSLASTSATTNLYIRAMRGSTALDIGDAASNRMRASQAAPYGSAVTMSPMSGWVQDATPGAGTVTYKLQLTGDRTENYFVNRSSTDTDTTGFARAASKMSLKELMA